MQFPIILGLRRSLFMDSLVVVVAILSAVSSLLIPHGVLVQSVLIFLVFGLAIWVRRSLEPSITALRLERNGAICIRCPDASEYTLVEFEPASVVHPWLTVVRLKTRDGKRLALIILFDSLKSDGFRRLRMFLRWQAKFSGFDGDA